MTVERSRVYAILLRLLPRSFRVRYEEELQRLFSERLVGRSFLGRMHCWLGACHDVATQAIALRARRRRLGAATSRARGSTMDGLVQDLRFALRSLARRPAFAAVAVTVLALGIGSTTTIFSVVNGTLLRPLPYPASERIGILWHDLGIEGGQSYPVLNPLDLIDYRAWSATFESSTMGTSRLWPAGAPDDLEIVGVSSVEAGFFEFFGVQALHGRTIRAEDDVPGAERVAVLGHEYWTRRYAGSRAVVGSTVQIDGAEHRVVGELPRGFQVEVPREALFVAEPAIWVAARFNPEAAGSRTYTTYTAFVRLRPDVTFDDAQRELDGMASRLRRTHAVHAQARTRARIVPLKDDVVKSARSQLVFVFVAVVLVLLVACANVSNLLLARVRAREAEMAIRTVLGAGRRRVFRLILLESFLVAGVAGSLGVMLSRIGVRTVRALGRETLPRAESLTVDGRVLLFALGASILAALVAGLAPAARGTLVDPSGPLASTRSSPGRRAARLRDRMIMTEVALTLALLVGTGLMLRSFWAVRHVDPGYATEGVLTTHLSLRGLPDAEARLGFLRSLEERLGAIPGVSDVSTTTQLPLTGVGMVMPYGYDRASIENWETVTADARWVTPGFFATIGAQLLSGRDFTWADVTSSRPVVILDEGLAARAFPAGGAVGRTLVVSRDGSEATIVGVVKHLRLHDLTRSGKEQMYFPMRGTRLWSGSNFVSVIIRSDRAPEEVTGPVRSAIDELAPQVARRDVATIEALAERAIAPQRALLVLMTGFGVLALALSVVGLYGVLTFAVRLRTKEIGIRVTLGQSPAEARWWVLSHALRLVAWGVVFGLAAALAGGYLARSLLFGVAPVDPATYVVVVAVLVGSGASAAWLPAHRATRVDPVEALRPE